MGYWLPTDADVRVLREMLQAIQSLGGIEPLVKALRHAQMPPRDHWRRGRITSTTATATVDALGNPVKWRYGLVEVTKNALGYSTGGGSSNYATLTDGFATTVDTLAYNWAEDMNDGSGVQSTGLDHDDEDIVMQPVPVGTPVWWWFERVGETLECWFLPAGTNGEDCAA